MKKYGILIAVFLLAMGLCFDATAEETEPTVYTSGDYQYTLLVDGTVQITRYTGGATDLTVPDTLDGYRVTAIGASVFYEKRNLRSILLPEGVTSIGDEAFSYCSELKSVSLPDSLIVIGDEAFAYCKINSIILPEKLTDIGDRAFYDCSYLKSIVIPDSVTKMGSNPFAYCSDLTDIYVSPDHPVFSVADCSLFNKVEKKLVCFPYALSLNVTEYQVPDGTLCIGEFAFDHCFRLTNIFIPESVTSIEKGAFDNCDGLTCITIPDSVKVIGNNPFVCCDQLTEIRISPEHEVFAVIDGVLFNKTEKN